MGTQIAGRYELEREVGRGGMGAVWLGRDVVLNREVALKRVGLTPGTDSTDVERVRREARVSAMLNHEHVVAVYDLVADGHDQWLVMEYVPSMNLGDVIRREGALSPDEAARLVGQAAIAVAEAHRAGIVHRDIKPGNMLVTDDRRVKLGDFGIARTGNDPTLTQTGLVTGSPGYLAPEVASGAMATPASDVWSLGATVFHAVTGAPPYDTTENLIGALYRIVHEEPPRTDRAGWLDPLLRATMHREPEGRWSAQQVADFLNGGPGQVAPPAPVARVTRREAPAAATAVEATQVVSPVPSRHRRSRLPAVLGLVLLVGVLALGAWLVTLAGGTSDPPGQEANKPPPPSTSSTPADPPTAQDMTDFVTDYLATVTTDPNATWKMLTPSFQEASGGYGSYSDFWGGIGSAKVSDVVADPATLEVSYHVDYTIKGGSNRSDDVRLRLAYDDGTYKINDEL